MTIPRCRTVGVLLIALSLIVAAPGEADDRGDGADPDARVELRLKPVPAGVDRLYLEAVPGGEHVVVMVGVDGREERLTPAQFLSRVDRDTRSRGFLFALLNITSAVGIAWVALGLLGQVVFAGRMVVQWLVSERQRRSVVPVAFWWMSLAGASMMLVYFVWRRDIVGVLGQATGWVIYVRNLWLIRRERSAA